MKTTSDFLWRLIHSLDKGEKTFFRRNFAVSGRPGQRAYLSLFSAIASQKKYDEAAILKKFSPVLNKKNIAFQKHYLQRQICDAIVQYNSRQSVHHDIYYRVQQMRLYRQKGMPDEAHVIWKKAVSEARSIESFAHLNLLKTEFEKSLLFSNIHTPFDELHEIFKGNIVTYNEYAGMITLRDIYTETLLLKRRAHFDFDENLRARIHSLLERVKSIGTAGYGRSFWFRHYYRMNLATLGYLLNDMEASMKLLQEVWSDWKRHPGFIRTDPEFYIEVLYMINYVGVLRHSFQYIEEVLNDVVNDQIREPAPRANFEAIKFLALNKIFNKTARYEEVRKLLTALKSRYRQWEPLLNSDLNRTIHLSLGIGCFVTEQYEEALYYIKRGLNLFKEGTREEHTSVGHILLLLTCYSLNNSKLFDAQYRSTYAYFYRLKKKHPFEKALLQCLHRTFYMKDNKSRITEYSKALEVFEKNKDDVVQQMAVNIFNYPGWLTSKVKRISYRQFVEQKLRSIPGAAGEDRSIIY